MMEAEYMEKYTRKAFKRGLYLIEDGSLLGPGMEFG